MQFHLVDQSTETDLAAAIADGQTVTTPSGLPPLILTQQQYFNGRFPGDCPHPQGWPCTTNCTPLAG